MALVGCKERASTAIPADPLDTVKQILSLHGVLGKRIEERSESDRHREPDPAALAGLFADYRDTEPFLANLYVGFVTGVLARYQENLSVTIEGARARVSAGALDIYLRRESDKWRVLLDRSVPPEIKRRARTARAQVLENGRISAR